MKMTFGAAIALFALNASPVQAAGQTFDLVCTGKSKQQYHFRFDVAQKKWCLGECLSVWSIDQLADSMIELSIRTKDDSEYWNVKIDRYTSKFWAVRRGYGSDPKEWGECEARAFSGFPQKKF
ncbi:MAG: hypothetical protein IBJ12_07530 [Sphingomonadaceae bacterium]|nr:hypothetical protein [Sphingomonadaceae bacterium]